MAWWPFSPGFAAENRRAERSVALSDVEMSRRCPERSVALSDVEMSRGDVPSGAEG